MAVDKRNLLKVLKAELKFVEAVQYHPSAWAYWGPQFIFEDSPTCMNFGKPGKKSCTGCLLMQFVPLENRRDKTPCRHIPLNADGATLAAFYHYGTQEKLESIVAAWLRTTIGKLEQDEADCKAKNSDEVLCLPDGKKLALCDACASITAAGGKGSCACADHSN